MRAMPLIILQDKTMLPSEEKCDPITQTTKCGNPMPCRGWRISRFNSTKTTLLWLSISALHDIIRVSNKSKRFHIVLWRGSVETLRILLDKCRSGRHEREHLTQKQGKSIHPPCIHFPPPWRPDGSETTSVQHWRIWLPLFHMNMFILMLDTDVGGTRTGGRERWTFLCALGAPFTVVTRLAKMALLYICFFGVCVFELTCQSPHQDVISQP